MGLAVAVCGLVTGATLGLGTVAAGAYEHGNPNYLGILSAQAPTGYPVSPASLDLSSGPVTINVSVAVTNLTATDQTVPMNFSVHHILSYQGVDISDGQPGQPGITFPKGSHPQTVQVIYGPKQSGTFTVPASGQATVQFSATIGICGYFQIDFNHGDGTGHNVHLASGFTRALGCSSQLGTRLTPGFWKNHQTATEALLSQTLGGYVVSSFTQVSAIFDAMKCSAPANCMAAHLLAAQLDVTGGSSSCIASTISDANAFFRASPTTARRATR